MTTTYGLDLDCVEDLHITLRAASSEKLALAQAIARRMQTPRGRLLDDPEYGYDLRRWIGTTDPPVALIEAAIASEARKDERVSDCSAIVTFDRDTHTIDARFAIVPRASSDSFDFTLSVGSLTASVLLEGSDLP